MLAADRDPAVSLVSTISDRLERMIINGEIAAGEKVNELALSQQLQVSRSVVREAVRLLERSGLVILQPNRGMFVRRVSLKGALDLFDIRAGLAATVGRLAAMRATDAQVAMLTQLHEEMIAICKARDFSAYYDANQRFHSLLLTCSGNERLAQLDEMMSNELQLFRRRNLGNSAQLEVSLQEHARVVEGIRERDAPRSARAFERHIMLGRQRMLDTLSTDSDH